MKPKNPRLALLFITLAAAPLARATDYTFTGTTAGTFTWSSGTNWSAVPVSASTTDLFFGTGQSLANNTAIVSDQNIASPPFLLNSLTLSYSFGNYTAFTIQGGQLNFVSDSSTTPTITLTRPGALSQLQIKNAVNFGNNTAIDAGIDIMFSGGITNTGGAVVTKSGAGTMRIESSNSSYTGDFNVTGGIFQVGNNGSTGDAGSGTVMLSGGSSFIVRRNGGTLALNNTITGTGNVAFQTRGGFIATINKANDYIGTTTLEASASGVAGGIKLGIDNGLSTTTAFSITNNGSSVQTFDLNGFNQTLGSLATTVGGNTTNSIITNGGAAKTLTISNSSGSTTYAGLISGAIALKKSGGSTQVLSGSNTYTGLTTVDGGVLQVNHGSALGSTAAGTVVNGTDGSSNFVGTVLDLNGVTVGSGESLTLDSGTATNNRVTLRSVGSSTNTWAGSVSLTGSKSVQLSANSGQLTLSGAVTQSSFTGSLTLRGTGTGTLSGGVSLSGSTTITVQDGGTWNINTSGNTWGTTNVFNGTLVLGANNALPTGKTLNLGGDANSGALKLNGRSQTVAGLTTGGTGTANKVVGGSATAGALTVNNSTGNVFSGVLGGTGTDENHFSLTKSGAGTLTLSGANTYTGATTIDGGVLNITGSTPAGSAVAVGGAGATGTPTLSGSGSVNGAVTVNSAGGGAAGRLNAGDATSVTEVGALTMGSTLDFESGSIFEWDINANKDGDGVGFDDGSAGTDFDSVSVTGNIDVGSAAIFRVVLGTGVSMTDPFWSTPYVTQTWNMATIFGKSFNTGSFSTVQTSTDVSSYGAFTITGGGTALTWTAVPEPTSALAGLLITAGLVRRRRCA